MDCPSRHGRFMGDDVRAQVPLRLTPERTAASITYIEQIARNTGYQGEKQYFAAKKWEEGIGQGSTIWLGISGAATPVGLGGMVADLISQGLVDVIVSTGANVYHDLHFACGLPVRHGSEHMDDDALRGEEATRIYTQLIHNRHTLKMQDLINETIFDRLFKAGRLKQPFSTAMMLHEFGKELADSEFVADREGSFVLMAAQHGVPIFLDSGSNHSLGMDLSYLALRDGFHVDSSPSRDMHQAAALSLYNQPQLNIFLGEGGPRNFTQTTAPTAAEIFGIPFEGSDGCIRFTTADERAGALSGSTGSEAVTWGKYVDARSARDIVVWGEYTTTAPLVCGYVAGKIGERYKPRLINRLSEFEDRFRSDAANHAGELTALQTHLLESLPQIREHEMALRQEAEGK